MRSETPLLAAVVALTCAAACVESGPGPEAPKPERIDVVGPSLQARADTCRRAKEPARCMAAAPKIAGEPEICASFETATRTVRGRDGREVVVPRGTWREVPNWELVGSVLLQGLPTVGVGERRSLPLASMAPSDDDAPLPRRGHFLPAFQPLRAAVPSATADELAAAEREIDAFSRSVEGRAALKDDRAIAYSRACFELLERAAAVLTGDLVDATAQVRAARERSQIQDWHQASLRRCDAALDTGACGAPPAFATEADRARCAKECAAAVEAATERVVAAAVKACAEVYLSSAGKERPGCTFAPPTGSTIDFSPRGATCNAACETEGKRLIADAGERERAKTEGRYLVHAFKTCMKAAQLTPDVVKWKGRNNKERADEALEREAKRCRYAAKCDWLEKYSDRKCEAEL